MEPRNPEGYEKDILYQESVTTTRRVKTYADMLVLAKGTPKNFIVDNDEKTDQQDVKYFWSGVSIGPVDSKIKRVTSKHIIAPRFGGYNTGWSSGTELGRSYQYLFKPSYDCTAIQLVFGNWSLGNSVGGNAGELTGLNPITVKASVYINATRQVTFNGQSSVVINPGQTVKSDIIHIRGLFDIPCFVKTYVSVANLGEKWPLGFRTISTNNEGSVASDITVTGVVSNSSAPGYHPFAIFGTPLVKTFYKTVGLFGDSILDGNANSGGATEADQGWLRRGLDALKIPWVKMTVGGDTMGYHLGNNAFQLSNMVGLDIAISNYGANDLAGFAGNVETAKAMYIKYWNALSGICNEVRQATILPRNEFNAQTKALRIVINDWIRTTPYPLSGYLELADLAETARNSSEWKAGISNDFIHPNVAGEIALSSVIVARDYL